MSCVVMTERVYNGYPVNAQQKCLAHLRRHFKKVFKLGHGNNPASCQAFLDLIDEAFAKHRCLASDSGHKRKPKLGAKGFKLRVTQSIQQWIGQAGYEAGLLVRKPRDKAEQWWYFQGPPEVPPDNNLAPAFAAFSSNARVKSVGGLARWIGLVKQQTCARVIQTCRRQGRSVMEFFRSALMAQSSSGTSQPSLLPQPTT